MAKRFLVVWLMAAAPVLAVCSRQSKPEGAMTTAPVNVSNLPSQAAQKGGNYSLGVPACDEFFKKYEDCIVEKSSEENRQALRLAYEKTVEQVHLQYEKDRASIPSLCMTLRDGIKVALSSLACTW